MISTMADKKLEEQNSYFVYKAKIKLSSLSYDRNLQLCFYSSCEFLLLIWLKTQVPAQMRVQELQNYVIEKAKLNVDQCWSLFEIICNGELGEVI